MRREILVYVRFLIGKMPPSFPYFQYLILFSLIPHMKSVEEGTAKLKEVYGILADDVEAARKLGQSDPSPFAHRTLIRTHFALIDGLSYQLRRVALACGLADSTVLTSDEMSLLTERQYKLDDKGLPESSPNYQRFLPSLLFAMRCYAKVHGGSFSADTSVQGYASMKELVKIRNGLEHPKCATGLNLGDEQLKHALQAASWWKQNMLNLFQTCQKADEYWKAKLA